MARALEVRISEKENNINWSWDEINWPEVGRELYIIYKMNQRTEKCHWPKYDFIKDEIDTSDDELVPYLNKIKRRNIMEEQLYTYFKSIKKRIGENFDIIICANNKDLRLLLSPMWHCLKVTTLSFRYITSSILYFFWIKHVIVRHLARFLVFAPGDCVLWHMPIFGVPLCQENSEQQITADHHWNQ
ncbi:hypothetical protein F8M41_022319 [Gigaspora margarita]|uniref:Uncharacterized protein n=1 Tax=Gigaspora margarita TaxID=4874 RepID=A0A8H4EIA2_GIGMA|nr:hypothetical protein F8M41_022319 [Gigaspora margarita]